MGQRELTAALVIEGRQLLLLQNTKHGTVRFEPPGGKRRPGETIGACVVREAREELGISILLGKRLGVYATETPEGPFDVHMYFCSRSDGEPRICEPNKHAGFGWYQRGDLEHLRERGYLVPNLIRALNDLGKYLA